MTDKTDVVEELARAMFASDGVCSEYDWNNANEVTRVHFREQAQTSIIPIIDRLIAEAVAEERAANENLRADCIKLAESEIVAGCEGCGAWLLPDDDTVSSMDGVTGCWAVMTGLPSKCERPCYAYRVGKQDARERIARPIAEAFAQKDRHHG